MDKILHITLADGQARAMVAVTTDLVEAARATHDLTPTASAALGRTLTISAIQGAMLKNASDSVTVTIRGGGPIGPVVCVARADGKVKGYVGDPHVDLPLKPNGKLDVGGAVGHEGRMSVVKDLGLREPYIGQCELISGEIAMDFANYFTVSEQQPSLVALGVLTSGDAVLKAGGLLLQPMPGCPDEVIDQLELRSPMFADISREMTFACKEQLAEDWFRGMQPELLERTPLRYHCGCSRERMEKALISLGRRELESLIAEDQGAELGCHFCHSRYAFTTGELRELLQRASRD